MGHQNKQTNKPKTKSKTNKKQQTKTYFYFMGIGIWLACVSVKSVTVELHTAGSCCVGAEI